MSRRRHRHVISIDIEIALVGLAAMLEPATLLGSVLALVAGERPLRTGVWFYVGSLIATLSVGVLAAFVLGSAAASHTSTPKTWVSVLTIVAGAGLLAYALALLLRPLDRNRTRALTARMKKVASAPAPVILAAGAVLANPGVFMLIAAKGISQLNPGTAQYVLDWTLFTLVALLPLEAALLMLLIAPRFTEPVLGSARGLIERHGQQIMAVVLLGLAASLLRDGIAGVTG